MHFTHCSCTDTCAAMDCALLLVSLAHCQTQGQPVIPCGLQQDIKRVCSASQSHPMHCWGSALSSSEKGLHLCTWIFAFVVWVFFYICVKLLLELQIRFFLSVELQHVLMQCFYLPNPTSETRGD